MPNKMNLDLSTPYSFPNIYNWLSADIGDDNSKELVMHPMRHKSSQLETRDDIINDTNYKNAM